jgi:hypothetical protein
MSSQIEAAIAASDRQLKQQITEALTRYQVGSLRGVEVQVGDRAILLRGQVTSFYAKQLVQHSVRRLAGDSPVIDEIRVVTPEAFRDSLRLRHVAAAGIALLVFVFATGCSKAPPRPAVHPVSGKVTFDGRPAAGAQVVFHPKTATAAIPTPSAKADSQGNFSLTTYDAADGAPAGDYAVTVELRPVVTKNGELEWGPNTLPPQYGSPKTTRVAASITDGINNVPIKITR